MGDSDLHVSYHVCTVYSTLLGLIILSSVAARGESELCGTLAPPPLYVVGTADSVLLERCSLFRVVLIERLHCISVCCHQSPVVGSVRVMSYHVCTVYSMLLGLIILLSVAACGESE